MWKSIAFLFLIFIITACTSAEPTVAPAIDEAHFPQTTSSLAATDLLVRGELVLENGCLRVNGADTLYGDSLLLIWDPSFSTRIEQGVVQVVDNATGKVWASVHDHVEIGGGIAPNWIWDDIDGPVSKDCPGPYWLVSAPIKIIE